MSPLQAIKPAAEPIRSMTRPSQGLPFHGNKASCSIISPADSSPWKATLAAVDPQTRFYCEEWLPLLTEVYGFEQRVAIQSDRSDIVAALPFAETRSWLTGYRGVSLPFLDFCQPFASTSVHRAGLYDALLDHGRAVGWDYFELRGAQDGLEVGDPSISFFQHVVDLRPGADLLFSQVHPAVRRAVRKAEKEGVRVERSRSPDAMETFYELQCITRKRHGLPPQPLRFFRKLHARLIETAKGEIIIARKNGQALASAVYLRQGDIVHYKYGASNKDCQHLRGNNLVMWEAMRHFSEDGTAELHLGRNSLDNEGLRRYKLSWGATESIAHYHRYNLKTGKNDILKDQVFGLHNKVFRNLPKSLAKLAGNLFYKHIA